MRNTTKTWLIIATALVAVGCIIFAAVMMQLNWDFEKLSTVKHETNTYEISEDFNNISITTDTEDITFLLSGDGKCKVKCYEESNAKHLVEVGEDTLFIRTNEDKKWYEYIGVNIDSSAIIVYLPKQQYNSLLIEQNTGDIKILQDFTFGSVDIDSSTGDVDFAACTSGLVKIETSTGDIKTDNITCGALDLSTSTGEIAVRAVECSGDVTVEVSTGKVVLNCVTAKNIISSSDTGDIILKNVNALEKLSAVGDTGDVKFDSCDASEIFVKTDTGDVRGSITSEKVFITETDTGSVDVPKTLTGGKCEITTDTGDIKIEIKK